MLWVKTALTDELPTLIADVFVVTFAPTSIEVATVIRFAAVVNALIVVSPTITAVAYTFAKVEFPEIETLPVYTDDDELIIVYTVALPAFNADVFTVTFAPTLTSVAAFTVVAITWPDNVAFAPNKFQRSDVLPKLNALFVEGTKSPLACVVPVVVNVPVTLKLPPIERLPEILAFPITCKSAFGVVVLIPTRLFIESTNNTPESMLTFDDAIVTTFCDEFDVTEKLLIAALPVTANVPKVPTSVIPAYAPEILPDGKVPVDIFEALT